MSAAAMERALQDARHRCTAIEPLAPVGRVSAMVGTIIEARGIHAPTGSLHQIETCSGSSPLVGEAVGFRGDRTLLMPLSDPSGIAPSAQIRPLPASSGSLDATACLGRVLDGLGRPIDGGEPVERSSRPAPARVSSLRREPVSEALDVGVAAMNSLLTVGRGTRIGLFAAAGVGKSTLLGQIARSTDAEVFVIGLVGERGREVREFIERELGDALERAIVVVATSEEAPVMRRRAAQLATQLAEDLRARERNVLLLIDSLTRVCAAQREIGLASGEPPATRGYPPSVWSELPKLLERAGTAEGRGSITGIYTVLVEGDDHDEPVADAARSLLDGHIVLSRRLADRGHFPAIDVLSSVSRAMPQLVDGDALGAAKRAREILAKHADVEELVSIGAYQEGNDADADLAISVGPRIQGFLRQEASERIGLTESWAGLREALGDAV